MTDEVVWYVAYGSNMATERLNAYFLGSDATGKFGIHRAADDQSPLLSRRTISLQHSVYFAGSSARWQGGVAFLTLRETCETAYAVAYKMTLQQFQHLAASENGVEAVQIDKASLASPKGRGYHFLHLRIATAGEANTTRYCAYKTSTDSRHLRSLHGVAYR